MPTPPEFEVWSRYEELAMHFNGLLIQFRIQMLGGLAALATVGSYLVGEKVAPRKQRFGALALGSLFLAIGWLAAASLDLFYYTQLLKGSVAAITALEKGTPLQMSTGIERWVAGAPFPGGGDAAPWFFYGVVFALLVSVWGWATYMWAKENKTKKRDDDGQRRQHKRAEEEWKRVEVPDWRIVSDDLWNRVQEIRKDQAELAARFSDGKLVGRPPRKAATNLLAGLAQCGVCGGGMVVQTYKTSDGKPRRSHYLCSRKRLGKCTNDLRLELNETNEAVLSAIEKHALTPEAVERVIVMSEESTRENDGERLRRELKNLREADWTAR